MSGSKAAFAELDTVVHGSVHFGDNSVTEIKGCETILFQCKNGKHRSFTGVYYKPHLKANILSIGKLDEEDHYVDIKGGWMSVREPNGHLLAKIARSTNMLYMLDVNMTRLVCMTVHGKENAWRWHARLGHINMQSLQKLAQNGLVHGLPSIEHVDQLCEACLASKQRRTSFPNQAT